MRREARREDGDAARFLPGELSFVSLLVVRLVFSMKPLILFLIRQRRLSHSLLLRMAVVEMDTDTAARLAPEEVLK